MIKIRKAEDRGHFPPKADPPPAGNPHWLDSWHTFSFAEYYDPAFMHFRNLRVLNEDRVAPGAGFPTHSHSDMEILTVVLEGELQHKDSMGNTGIIRPGEVQRMSAGVGVTHSEYNASRKNPVHLLQIWILPDEHGLPPSYEQKGFDDDMKRNIWCLLASRHGQGASVRVHQDVSLLNATLEMGSALHYPIEKGRYVWAQVARGAVKLNDLPLKTSDGAAVSHEEELVFRASKDSEVLLFDLG